MINALLAFVMVWCIPIVVDFITVIGIERMAASHLIRDIFFYQIFVGLLCASALAVSFRKHPSPKKILLAFMVSSVFWVLVVEAQSTVAHYLQANCVSMLMCMGLAILLLRTVVNRFPCDGKLMILGPLVWCVLMWQYLSIPSDYVTHRTSALPSASSSKANTNVVFLL